MVDVGKSLAVVCDSLDIEATETALYLLCETATLHECAVKTVVYRVVACIVKEVTDSTGHVKVFDGCDCGIPFGIQHVHERLLLVVYES